RSKSLANRVAWLMRRAGVAAGGAHALRHTFATSYVRGGGSVVRLQRILGHSSVTMTMRYVHLVAGDLGEGHAQLSPLGPVLAAGADLLAPARELAERASRRRRRRERSLAGAGPGGR